MFAGENLSRDSIRLVSAHNISPVLIYAEHKLVALTPHPCKVLGVKIVKVTRWTLRGASRMFLQKQSSPGNILCLAAPRGGSPKIDANVACQNTCDSWSLFHMAKPFFESGGPGYIFGLPGASRGFSKSLSRGPGLTGEVRTDQECLLTTPMCCQKVRNVYRSSQEPKK